MGSRGLGSIVLFLTSVACSSDDRRPAPADRPSACSGLAMTYDRDRDRLVLLEAEEPGCRAREPQTWERDGTTWTMTATAGPAPRRMHRMTYDEARRQVVLFGGMRQDGTAFGDTWTWDGLRWTLSSTSGPPARYGETLSYDPKSERVLLFGGYDDEAAFRDLWSWDGVKWEKAWTGQTAE